MAQRAEKERNATRSRAAILDAAERLFAERGYDATSLHEVGAAAGVSRGTPGYFFGSKPDLYQAVLERAFAEVRDAVRVGRARALASSQGLEAILAGAVSDYFDFLAARPNFVRLIEREALNGAGLPEAPATSRPARRRSPRSAPSSASTSRRLGRHGPTPAQHHRALLVPPDSRPHGGARGRRAIWTLAATWSAGSATSWNWFCTESAG